MYGHKNKAKNRKWSLFLIYSPWWLLAFLFSRNYFFLVIKNNTYSCKNIQTIQKSLKMWVRNICNFITEVTTDNPVTILLGLNAHAYTHRYFCIKKWNSTRHTFFLSALLSPQYIMDISKWQQRHPLCGHLALSASLTQVSLYFSLPLRGELIGGWLLGGWEPPWEQDAT